MTPTVTLPLLMPGPLHDVLEAVPPPVLLLADLLLLLQAAPTSVIATASSAICVPRRIMFPPGSSAVAV
jgi:hypothetical protein